MKRFVMLITLIILTHIFRVVFGGDVEESSPELINNLEPTNLAPVLMIWDQTIPYGSKSCLTDTLWDGYRSKLQ